MIEHGMDFGQDDINLCCRIPIDYKLYKLVPDYKGGRINWRKFFKEKWKYRNMMRKGEMLPGCVNCPFLEEKEWDDENYIAHINFNHGLKCNQRCIYCDIYFIPPQRKPYNAFPAIKDMFKRGLIKGNTNITIAGGEPCISQEFTDLLNIFLEHDIKPIRILSNATIYNKALEEGIRNGQMSMMVSVDSGTKETYLKIKRTNTYEQVWDNIKKYTSVQYEDNSVLVKYILIPGCNCQKEEIDAWLDKSIECGVKQLSLDIELDYYEKFKNNISNEIVDAVKYVIEQAKARNLKLELINRSHIVAKENNLI